MKIKQIFFCAVAMLCVFSSVGAENTFDFLLIPDKIYGISDNIWEEKADLVQKYAYSMNGFTCQKSIRTKELFNNTIDIICQNKGSDYTGEYKITYSFDYDAKLRSFEIQAHNPGIDNFLAKTMYGMEDIATIMDDKITNLLYDAITQERFSDRLIHELIFSDDKTILKSCKEINKNDILCTGYIKSDSPSETNRLVLSVVSKTGLGF